MSAYRCSVEEYEKLGQTGILGKDDRVELLDGEIIAMARIGKLHAKAVRGLAHEMSRRFSDDCLVDIQNPMVLDRFSEPQPDCLLLRFELHETSELPRPSDVLLLVEVADSTYSFDSGAKLRAYARNGIREYWIVNLAKSCVEVYRQPQGETYVEQFQRVSGEILSPVAFPNRSIVIADVLP